MDIVIVCLYVSVGWIGICVWLVIFVVIIIFVYCIRMYLFDSYKMLLICFCLVLFDNLLE